MRCSNLARLSLSHKLQTAGGENCPNYINWPNKVSDLISIDIYFYWDIINLFYFFVENSNIYVDSYYISNIATKCPPPSSVVLKRFLLTNLYLNHVFEMLNFYKQP